MELHPRRGRLLLVSELFAESAESAVAIRRCCRRTAKCSATTATTAAAAALFDLMQNSPPVPTGMARCADGGTRHPRRRRGKGLLGERERAREGWVVESPLHMSGMMGLPTKAPSGARSLICCYRLPLRTFL